LMPVPRNDNHHQLRFCGSFTLNHSIQPLAAQEQASNPRNRVLTARRRPRLSSVRSEQVGQGLRKKSFCCFRSYHTRGVDIFFLHRGAYNNWLCVPNFWKKKKFSSTVTLTNTGYPDFFLFFFPFTFAGLPLVGVLG